MTLGVIISAISVLVTLTGLVIRESVLVGRNMERLDNLTTQIKEHYEEAEKKFNELFQFKSETQTTLSSMAVTLANINQTTQEIKQDIKEMSKR